MNAEWAKSAISSGLGASMLARDAIGRSGNPATPRVSTRGCHIGKPRPVMASLTAMFAPSATTASVPSVFDEKAYFVRLVGRIDGYSDQPGVSQREEYNKKLQAVGQCNCYALTGLQAGVTQSPG
jgi:hypothetical protein